LKHHLKILNGAGGILQTVELREPVFFDDGRVSMEPAQPTTLAKGAAWARLFGPGGVMLQGRICESSEVIHG